MERPKKPELEYEYKIDHNGVTVQQLTAESEVKWANYLREDHFARQALWRAIHGKEEAKEV